MTTPQQSTRRFLQSLPRGNSSIFALALLFAKLVGEIPCEDTGKQAVSRPKSEDIRDFHFLYANRENPEIGALINDTLAEIGGSDNELLHEALREIDFTDFRNDEDLALSSLIEKINASGSETSDSADFFDQAIDTVINSRYKPTEIPTPDFISELMVGLVSPRENDSIYDPVCGIGGGLLKVSKRISNGKTRLYGQEINLQIYAICMMRMYLHGIVRPQIACGDVFFDPAHIEDGHLMKFQVALLDPPFAVRHWNRKNDQLLSDKWNRFGWGIPMTGDYAFLLHTIKCLDEKNGRMAIILPFGALTRGGVDRQIREKLVANNLLDAVVCLPKRMYISTGIPLCILVIKMNRDQRDVLFIDASGEEHYEKRKNQNVLRSQDIDRIIRVCDNRETVEGYSRPITGEELGQNDFDLNISRYITPKVNESSLPLNHLKQEIAQTESELAEVRKKIGQRKF